MTENAPQTSPSPSSAQRRPRWELTAVAFASYWVGKRLHWSEGMLAFFRIFVVLTGYQLIEDRMGLMATQAKYRGRYLARMIFFMTGTVLLWRGAEALNLELASVGGGFLLFYIVLVRSQMRFFMAERRSEAQAQASQSD